MDIQVSISGLSMISPQPLAFAVIALMMAVFIRDRFTHLALLMIVVAVFSAFIKNIGALAIMMPIAFQFAKKSGVSPSK